MIRTSTPSPPLKRGIDFTKNPKKGRGRGSLGRGDSVGKEGVAVSLGIFPRWGVANVTTITFNYILVIVFLFTLNVGVSPCFDCIVLVPVYRMYTCFHSIVVSSCYRLHNFLFASWRGYLFVSECVIS